MQQLSMYIMTGVILAALAVASGCRGAATPHWGLATPHGALATADGHDARWTTLRRRAALLLPSSPTVASSAAFAVRSDWPSYTERRDLDDSVVYREFYRDHQGTGPSHDHVDRLFYYRREGSGAR